MVHGTSFNLGIGIGMQMSFYETPLSLLILQHLPILGRTPFIAVLQIAIAVQFDFQTGM